VNVAVVWPYPPAITAITWRADPTPTNWSTTDGGSVSGGGGGAIAVGVGGRADGTGGSVAGGGAVVDGVGADVVVGATVVATARACRARTFAAVAPPSPAHAVATESTPSATTAHLVLLDGRPHQWLPIRQGYGTP
jgi:hypothetical protein